MSEITITRHGDLARGEYRAHLAGSHHIGRLTWVSNGNVRIAEHTLVPAAIGGRGVAARLVAALIDDARELGLRIDPVCSYVAAAMRRNPEWARFDARAG